MRLEIRGRSCFVELVSRVSRSSSEPSGLPMPICPSPTSPAEFKSGPVTSFPV
jgi:hypothetical protein